MEDDRKYIDWVSTGNRLFRLRSDNFFLRRYVCGKLRKGTDKCGNIKEDCENCHDGYMDRSISRPELATVFCVSESVINNWETGRTEVGVEDLLFYCTIAHVTLDDILVYRK